MEIPSKAAKTQGLKGILYFKTVKDGILTKNEQKVKLVKIVYKILY